MTVHVITSPVFLKDSAGPGIYLAGGWYGIGSWQDEAVKILREQSLDMEVFVPMLTEDARTAAGTIRMHFGWKHSSPRPGIVMLFWFPKEYSFSPIPYTALYQLDWAVGNQVDFAVGVEPGCPYVDHVRARKSMYAHNPHTRSTLTETIADAVDIIR